MITTLYKRNQFFLNLLIGIFFWCLIRTAQWIDFQPDRINYILKYTFFDIISVILISVLLIRIYEGASKKKSRLFIVFIFILFSSVSPIFWILISNLLKYIIWLPGVDGFSIKLLKKATYSNIIFFYTLSGIYWLTRFRIQYILQKEAGKKAESLASRTGNLFNQQVNQEHLKDSPKKFNYNDSIYVKLNNSTSEFIRLNSIIFFTSVGNYTKLHVAESKNYMVLKTLKLLENELPLNHFIRIHRSKIINIEYIIRIEKYSVNYHKVYLKGVDEPIEISRRYAVKLRTVYKF
jgi:two-component system, LytTR family, response regulator